MTQTLSKARLLIGLTGGKGVGKDTIADHLVSTYGFSTLAFADPVREAAAAAFNVPLSVFTDVRTKETPLEALCGRTPRYVMQTLGTEWGKNLIRSDIWILHMQHRINVQGYRGRQRIVVSDVRYDDEAELVRNLGGEIWLVTRPDEQYASGNTHTSDNGVSGTYVSRLIMNNMDKKTLFTQVGVTLANVEKDALRRPDHSTAV